MSIDRLRWEVRETNDVELGILTQLDLLVERLLNPSDRIVLGRFIAQPLRAFFALSLMLDLPSSRVSISYRQESVGKD